MQQPWPAKDPQEAADYSYTPGLDAGDEIASHTVTVVSGTVVIDTHSASGTFVTVWLSGGVAGETAIIRIAIVTADGRTFEEDLPIQVVERSSPALAQFRIRFPTFITVPDETVQYWLTEGATQVAAWPADQDRAALLYAAHKLAEGRGAIAQGVTGFRSGAFSAQMADAAANRTGFSATVHGREYLDLARKHFSGGVPAWNPPACA